MSILTHVKDNLELSAGIVASLITLIPLIRKWCVKAVKGTVSWIRGDATKNLILEKLIAIEGVLSTNGDKLILIEKEMKFNGGKSVKDMLFIMFNYRRHDYWRIGHPAMELDGEAQVTLVSEAACRLFGVASPDDLKRRSWLRFIEPGCVDDMLHAYQDTVSFQSDFVWTFQVKTISGEPRGEWEFRASPITQENASTKIYSGYLSPMNDCALEVAKGIHWAQSDICKLCKTSS